ncbi:unnamed protein product [Malus baccata var. baccata]
MADLYSSTPSPAKREGQLQSPEQVALFEGFETLSRQISSRVNTNFPLIPFRKEEALRWVILWWSGIHHGPKMWFSGENLRTVRSLLFSALLGPFHSEEDSVEKYNEYPGEALMKSRFFCSLINSYLFARGSKIKLCCLKHHCEAWH